MEDYIALKPTRYSYADIMKITNQFQVQLGEGGYGTTYKEKLFEEVHVDLQQRQRNKYPKCKEISIPNAKTSLDLMSRLIKGSSFEKSHILKGLGLNFYYFIKSNIEIIKYISLTSNHLTSDQTSHKRSTKHSTNSYNNTN